MTRTLAILLLAALPGLAESLTATEIMRRVAENQTKAQDARKNFVYDMNVFVRMKRANGKLAREESREYIVAPGVTGAKRKLVKVEGKILDGKKETTYSEAGYKTKDMDIDGALTDSFAKEVMWSKSDLGPMVSWFPMTTQRIEYYNFKLEGEEKVGDHDVYKIAFDGHGEDDDCWKGEALIEKNEFQPVLIASHWTCKIPKAVTIIFGINVSNIGAKITYQRFDKDVWFPVNCGGELKLRVLFGYARTIGFSAKNTGFRKADVQSAIEFETEDEKPSSPTSTSAQTP